MNDTLSQHTLLARLRLPEATGTSLSFCKSPTPKHVEQWLESLPLTRINFVSSILYSALPELARLKTDGENHLKLLETVRPVVQSCIGGLAHTFINQPLILPTHALKAATVAQALQKHLSNAYLGALRDCVTSGNKAELVALAIHRALTGFGLLLLRSYQLYTPALNQLWVEIHTLYLLAEKRGLHQLPLSDPLNGNKGVKTIEQAYLRNILLTMARPNQLRQQ
ncbi:MAG TPA: molecular chaperone, partial [Marinobacter sp.]|nr:molecular chaperone [Marinobacter sp.]